MSDYLGSAERQIAVEVDIDLFDMEWIGFKQNEFLINRLMLKYYEN